MTNEFILGRHKKLWEEQNLLIKRVVISVLLIGFLILLKVLIPFVHNTEETITLRENITKVSEEIAPLEKNESELKKIEEVLIDIRKAIRRSPWLKEKDSLIRKLAKIKHESQDGGNHEKYQQAADKAIGKIAWQVGLKVIHPLENAIPDEQKSSDLAMGIATLHTDMEQWKQEQMGKIWYQTIHAKDEKMRELEASLRNKLANISPLLQQAQDKIRDAQGKLRSRKANLKNGIKLKKEDLKQLEKDMVQILPNWVSGLIDVRQMIQLFPFLFPLIAIYLFFLAVRLSIHFRYMVQGLSLSTKDLEDFSVSSIWTLVNRGFLSTVVTVVLYLAIIGVLWILFEQGMTVLKEWFNTKPEETWFSGDQDIRILLWVGRSIFIALFGLIFFRAQLRYLG